MVTQEQLEKLEEQIESEKGELSDEERRRLDELKERVYRTPGDIIETHADEIPSAVRTRAHQLVDLWNGWTRGRSARVTAATAVWFGGALEGYTQERVGKIFDGTTPMSIRDTWNTIRKDIDDETLAAIYTDKTVDDLPMLNR